MWKCVLVVVLIVFGIGLCGCQPQPQTRLAKLVHTVGPATLMADAERLAVVESEEILVDPASLPASFRAFAPVETWRMERCFLIVTERWLQHRTGIYIQPVSYGEPRPTGNDVFVKIAPGIYYHTS